MKGAFLLGASRSGSTMMSEVLRLHPDILSLSELISTQGARAFLPGEISGADFWRQLSEPSALMPHLANPDVAPNEFLYHKVPTRRFDPYRCPPIAAVTLPHLFDDPDSVFDHLASAMPQMPRQSLPDHYRGLFQELGALTGQDTWVERSGGTLLATATLADRFPEARFVTILRDGRDVALSMQAYKPSRFVIWMWKRARVFGIDILKADAHIGTARWMWWTEELSGRLLPVQRILGAEPDLADCAAFWSALTKSGLKQLEALPQDRRIVLHYDDILADPRAELTRLARFLDVAADDSWLSQAARIPERRPRRFDQLPRGAQYVLERGTEEARAISDAWR